MLNQFLNRKQVRRHISQTLVFHGRSKYIEIIDWFIKEVVENGEIKMEFCNSKQWLVDIFTKPIGIATCMCLRGSLGIVNLDQEQS